MGNKDCPSASEKNQTENCYWILFHASRQWQVGNILDIIKAFDKLQATVGTVFYINAGKHKLYYRLFY